MLAKPRTRTALIPGLLCASLLLGVALLGTARADEPNPQVRVTTNMGEFVIELRPDRAPITVANFLRYVKEGYYTDTLIHRVIANFVIQGGGHDADDLQAQAHARAVFNESGNGLQNKRGTVGLARSDAPHSGNAQFYVNLVDNPDLDPVPTRWGYAVFGTRGAGHGRGGPHRRDATGAIGPVQVRRADEAGDHPEESELLERRRADAPPAPHAGRPTRRAHTILSPK